ncbi:hypothetical protein [Paenibacillus lentus]|uniref:Uncharacterized protein n=1 Tax=Paenibacillus lentus TaxID=1338368 RepID=A0A3S8RV13_9BACL|nr:hypothetical protein [Paenibacillus lentus]AZK46700.1 hypothetical protein EIM92_11500 [Paenibacillus lentus]
MNRTNRKQYNYKARYVDEQHSASSNYADKHQSCGQAATTQTSINLAGKQLLRRQASILRASSNYADKHQSCGQAATTQTSNNHTDKQQCSNYAE